MEESHLILLVTNNLYSFEFLKIVEPLDFPGAPISMYKHFVI